MDETVLRFAPKPDQGTGTAPSDETHPIVMVLGMHRSGTSLCSHILSALGVDMADRLSQGGEQPAADNPKGHWERWEIVDLHDRVLGLFNRGYFSPVHDFGFPSAWWADPRVKEVRQALVDFLRQHRRNDYFGFKDPRTVRMVPLWRQITAELSLTPKIIYCLRNPAQVARSLRDRDGLRLDQGEYRWFLYNMELFLNLNEYDFCTIEYETWFDNPHVNLEKLRKFLSLPSFLPEGEIETAVAGIVDEQLRHDDQRLNFIRQPLVRKTYELAQRADRDLAAREQLRGTAAQFALFQRLQFGLQTEIEAAVTAAARLPEIERSAAALHEAEHQRDAHAAGLHAAQTELDAVRGALGDAEARAAVAEALRQEIATLQAELPEIRYERDAHGAGLQAAQAELEALRHSLADAEARAAAAAVLQQEVTALRTALPEVERVRDEQAAGLQAAQAELEMLRQALGDAEERAATAEALRQEIAALQIAVPEIERARDEQAAGLQAAQIELDASRQALAEAERRATAAEALREQLAELRNAVAASQQEVVSRIASLGEAQAQFSALAAALTQAQRESAERQSAEAQARGEIARLERIVGLQERQLQEKTAALAAAGASLAAAEQRAFAVEDSAREHASLIATLQDNALAAERAAQDLRNAETAARAEISRLERRSADAELAAGEKGAAIAVLQLDLAQARAAAATAEGNTEAAREALRKTLAALSDQPAPAGFSPLDTAPGDWAGRFLRWCAAPFRGRARAG